MGQLYREDNAHKVRRGLAGRVGQGLNAGGKAYGYAPAVGEKGKRIIVEAEAKIVQRIFEEYVAGRTPREIAYDLNNEGISPPRGRSWNASTINGNMQRRTGIIQNELYAGRLVWNKVRMIKDPDTGKRLSRPNAKNDRQTTDVPDLRVISQKLFDAAQCRKQARGNTDPNQQRRPRHMLSGPLRCGACGAGMSTNGRDKSERIRIRCSSATESGVCRDAKTFYLTTVESAVLAGLEAEMRQHGDPALLGPRSSVLDEERKQVTRELNAEPAVGDVISLHPAVLARYEQQLVHLQDALSKGVNAGDSEAAEAVRDLVETVTVFRNPSHPGGVTVEIVVAREGLEPPTPGL